jgi:hypothetical protein
MNLAISCSRTEQTECALLRYLSGERQSITQHAEDSLMFCDPGS